MVHRLTALACYVAIAAPAWAAVDFTPRETFYLAEGTRVPNVTFRNGSADVPYSPPGNWILSGGGRKLTLTPPNKVQAGASLQTDPVKDPLPATDANVKAYSDRAVALIPREASKTTIDEAGLAPLKVCNHALAQITLSYVLFGQQFTTTIYFLPLEKEQLTFQLSAKKADFATLARDFRMSLFSLQGL